MALMMMVIRENAHIRGYQQILHVMKFWKFAHLKTRGCQEILDIHFGKRVHATKSGHQELVDFHVMLQNGHIRKCRWYRKDWMFMQFGKNAHSKNQ